MNNDFQQILDQLDAQNQQSQDNQEKSVEELQRAKDLVTLKKSIKAVSDTISAAIDKKSNVVKVDNFPTSFSTPDIQAVVDEIQALRKQLDDESAADDITDAKEQAAVDKQIELLTNLEKAVRDIPGQIEMPEAPEQVIVPTNQEYLDKIQAVIDAVKAIKTEFKPNISVKPADVKVNNDFSILENKLDVLTTAVKAINLVVPENDDTAVLDALEKVSRSINSLTFPMPNYILPFKDITGKAVQVQLDASGNVPVSGTGGGSTTTTSAAATDLFNTAIIGSRYNQVEIDYSTADPDVITDITVTKTSGGDAATANGQAVFSTGTSTTGGIKAVTNTSIIYRPHSESYAAFSAIFTAGVANSYQRIGIYDTNNGFFIGYEGTAFGITIRQSASDTRVASASFNKDLLDGGAASKYTRNGTPEALDPTKDNLYRIRYGWLGASGIYFEVLSPDQTWVTFHIHRVINTAIIPSIANPNLPITLDARKTAGTTNLIMNTACWAAGSTSNLSKVTDTISDNTLASTNRSVIVGRSSAGGGTYNNVKVTPSGSLTVALGDITGVVGQQTKANSLPVTIASDQTIGGGTEYAEGATAATATGGVIMGKNGTTVKAAQTDASGNLRVDLSQTSANTTAIKVDGSATTQPVSGSVSVSNFPATQAVSGTVTANTGLSQPLTDTQLRATAVPISGTVTANAGTGSFTVTQSTAANLKVDLSGTASNATPINVTTSNTDLTAAISISSAAQSSGSITTLNGQGTYVFQLTGTWSGNLQVQITADGTNYLNITDSYAVNSHTLGTFMTGGNITANGIYQVDCSGLSGIRLISTSWTSGSVTGTARASTSDALTAIEGQTNVVQPTATALNATVVQLSPGNLQTTVTPITITKGTQGAVGFTTQDLKDAGRTSVMISASVASTATTETLISINKSLGLAATTAATSNTITSGKKFRIQGIYASARNSTGTVTSNVTIRLRAAAGAATTVTSPIQFQSTVNLPASAASTLFPTVVIPDGFEIDSNAGTNTYGVTITHPQWVTGTAVATFDISIVGYEY